MARLYEYQGKVILKKMGIPVPAGRCVSTAKDAGKAAREIGKDTVIKAQVWATGRFKAGGIKFADTPQEAAKAAGALLGSEIKGLNVEKVLVEEQLEVDREVYVGVIVSNSHKIRGPILIFSSEGGSSIEEVSKRNPERIGTLNVDYLKGVTPQDAKKLLSKVAFTGKKPSAALMDELAKAVCNVYKSFVQYDARSIEVNPLIVTKDKRVLAADCHCTIDDNSVYRHPEFEILVARDMDRPPTELEKKGLAHYRGRGLPRDRLFLPDGDQISGRRVVGIPRGIGGGGAMLGASAFVTRGFKIANYADTSGDPAASKIYLVIKSILALPIDGYVLMGATLANQEQWHHAHALVKVFKEFSKVKPGFPVILLVAGNKEAESHEIIKRGFKDLPLRWELYGREYIYKTDFMGDRVMALVKEYQNERKAG